jgi:chromate reductase
MATKATTSSPLKCILFMGSARTTPTAWNADDTGRLGDRVLKFFTSRVAAWNATEGNTALEVEVFDTNSMPWAQETMKSPMYFLKSDAVSDDIKAACAKIEAADCYVVLTPEYNHTMPSALTNLMNQFGGSKYAYKVSGCICYSMSQTGGSRVAQALRPYLSELGCLPVSKQVIYSSAYQLFDQEGVPREGQTFGMRPSSIKDSVEGQCDGLLKQLSWWATAAKQQRSGGLP